MSRLSCAVERLRHRAERGAEGFTLVEVLIAVTIQALIIGALGMAFVGILNGTQSVNQSLSRSSDARLAAAYFVTDSANSSGPEVSLSDTTSCPDPSPPVAGTATAVVRFSWSSTSSAGAATTNIVNYVLVSNSLLRRVCKNGVLLSDKAVASNVQTAVASCLPTANCSGTPSSVKVVVTSVADTSGNQYSYTLSGTFRKLNGAGPTSPSNPRVVMTLGSGTNCSAGGTGISLTASSSFRAYGDVYVNSINAACKALSFTSNATYQAGGTNIVNGGTCASTTGATPCPAWNTYTPLTDPYAGLPVPSNGTPRGGCSGGVGQPGVYAATLNLTGTSCQLASGTYVFQNGITVAGNSSASASLTSASGGVFIYITGGSITTGSYSSHTGTINLQPLTTGTYKGVSIWQAAADTTNPNIAGTGSSISLGGAWYVPGAQVSISSDGDSVISSIVARTIWMASGNVVFGTKSASPLMLTGPTSYTLEWTVNRPYPSATLTASGGDGNYIWKVVGLPPGVTVDPVTGVVSGTPTTAGTYYGSVTLNDLLGDDELGGLNYSLKVNPAPNITTTSLTAADRTVAYTKTFSVSGGTSGYTWSATGLPAGLTMSSGGVLSGTPTTAATSSISVTVTDAAGATDTQSISLTVNNVPNITTSSLAGGTQSSSYTSAAAAATLGTTPYTWSVTSGMPSGLSINSNTGVISGTPSASGTSTVVLKVTDAAGGTDTQSLSLVIAAAPTVISSVSLSNGSGTSGTIDQGDTITIAFSKTMDVSDFCSSWSNDTTDQSLSSNSDVTVTATNGTHDSITVSSATCTFHLGTIDMGSGGYVSSTATFKGTYSSKSTITWDVSAKSLIITLGAKASGSVSNVSSSTPVFTIYSGLSDTSGNTITNSPYTLSSGRKF